MKRKVNSISDAIDELCEYSFNLDSPIGITDETARLARIALREQEERTKGCGYCTGENPPPIVENSETCIFYNRRANEFYDGAYPLDWTACPVCGRKLDGGGQDG